MTTINSWLLIGGLVFASACAGDLQDDTDEAPDTAGIAADSSEPEADPEIGSSSQPLLTLDPSCNFTQTLVLLQSMQWAINVSKETSYALQNGTWKDGNFKNWFGTVPVLGRAASDNLVKTRLTNIIAMMTSNNSLNYTVTCQDHPSCNGFAARAQVFNGVNYVRFCPNFFGMPLGGPDGQGATWLHELAHLSGAWTDVYTVVSAGSLARNDPKTARNNASNYQYYFLHVTP